VRIFKTYGSDAIQVMTENPYRLARDIRGIGFKTADAIAMKLGTEKTAMVRVRAGISYALTEAMDEGHCGLPTEELIPHGVSPTRSAITVPSCSSSSSAVRMSSCGTSSSFSAKSRRQPTGHSRAGYRIARSAPSA
jgi:hypothetical protein